MAEAPRLEPAGGVERVREERFLGGNRTSDGENATEKKELFHGAPPRRFYPKFPDMHAPAESEPADYAPGIETLQDLGDELRLRVAEHPGVLHTQATMGRGEPKLWLDADEARLAGLSLSDIAAQLQGGLEGTLGGSVIEDLEELDVRIRFEDERRSDLFDIRSTHLTAAGRQGWTSATPTSLAKTSAKDFGTSTPAER